MENFKHFLAVCCLLFISAFFNKQEMNASSGHVPIGFIQFSYVEIEYALPDAVRSARLYIYSISGKLAESRTIEGRGNGKLSIDTSKLSKGIYLYTVIADGQSVTSRQMIVQ